jgi:hypothetical protein
VSYGDDGGWSSCSGGRLVVRDGGEGITLTGEEVGSEASLSIGDDESVIMELLAQYEEMVVVELLNQKEWQVHGSQVMTSVINLSVHADSMAIPAHLRKICTGSTI